MTELKSCPWCGGKPKETWYDRVGSIGCDVCGYSISFKGLLRIEKSDVPVIYKHEDGTAGLARDGQTQEYYHQSAHEQAYEFWNKMEPKNMTPLEKELLAALKVEHYFMMDRRAFIMRREKYEPPCIDDCPACQLIAKAEAQNETD